MLLLVTLAVLAAPANAGRVTMPLDGVWDAAESREAAVLPQTYPHRAPVPGLTNLAQPPFADVDRFESPENRANKQRLKIAVDDGRQPRDYFWYRTRFRPAARREAALLEVKKAQFGTAVWLNGRKVGEHLPCFTAGRFLLTEAMRWDAENELVIRIGAHPGVLPDSVACGTDKEKNKWTPGIYDSVSLILADNPVIESVQVAPRLASSEIQVQTVLRNYGARRGVTLVQQVEAQSAKQSVTVEAGGQATVLQTVRVPNARLWTPEQPSLYSLKTATAGDSVNTRFGMREFRFDTATRRAYLNGKPYFLRGSNITLHRFFEDPHCKGLPWDDQWVRKLLVEIPRRMHWNSFRFCIGPVPDKWLDIADEAGLLIENEFFLWGWRPQWDLSELTGQYREWMRDNWNHPSVAVWDAQNETRADQIGEIINKVRGLDLSGRPWENGYNLPAGPDDPIEDHPYLFSRLGRGFEPPDLERMTGAKSTNSAHPSAHAVILNEYGWVWLNRDGTPTELTKEVYARLAGPNATARERFELNAYYVGGLTEFWRAHRNFAGVLHFVYLT
ncbi:MAG: glycoside hydrolase family 2 TIM barrel-domain containing protein, partial [Bryobacteraceae bacterium]